MTDDRLSVTVHRYVEREHPDLRCAIESCADRVAADWSGDRASNRRAVATPLERCLESTGATVRLTDALSGAVDAIGYELPREPVAKPPYVVVTSRGPVCRATIEPGRLVIRFDAFEVSRSPEPGYRRLEDVRVSVFLE